MSTPPTDKAPAVTLERRESALWLRLNRPDSFNGLDPTILDGLAVGLDTALADSSVRCVVIGAVGRAFCAGADLKHTTWLSRQEHPGGRHDASMRFLHHIRSVFERVESFEKPVIAAVEGIAVGGGLELLLCCDLIVAAEGARLGDAHAKFGQVPGGGATVRLPRRVGPAFAKRLMFTGEILAAREFLHTDLVDRVVPDGAVVDAVDGLVAQIAQNSPVGLARMKALVQGSFDMTTTAAVTAELDQSDLHRHSEDWHEGITAFTDKRTPTFSGR